MITFCQQSGLLSVWEGLIGRCRRVGPNEACAAKNVSFKIFVMVIPKENEATQPRSGYQRNLQGPGNPSCGMTTINNSVLLHTTQISMLSQIALHEINKRMSGPIWILWSIYRTGSPSFRKLFSLQPPFHFPRPEIVEDFDFGHFFHGWS